MSKSTVSKPRYTYTMFAEDAVKLATDGEIADITAFIEKANDLIDREVKRAETAKNNPKKRESKMSPETVVRIATLKKILNANFQTGAQLGEQMGIAPSSANLTVANLAKHIDNCISVQKAVKMTVTDSKGLTSQKLYTGYRLMTAEEMKLDEDGIAKLVAQEQAKALKA